MATEGVVITQANEDTPNIGGLFDGISFLVGLRVPMRSNFLDRIRANGGRIVRLEAQADHIIADHMRNDCPPNSLSYTYIEAAISAGALPDKNHHRAGPAPGYARTVGSTVVPPKSTRTAFTPQDDRDLWNWVQGYKNRGVHGIKGNEIYKQLEALNPRHTFQSWRDRYVKRLMANPPPGVQVQPNAAVMAIQQASSRVRPSGVDGTVEDEEEAQDEQEVEEEDLDPDVLFLLENIDDILNIPVEDLDAVWGSLADEETSSHLSADQWKRLYEEEALPAYRAREEKAKRARASPMKRRARVATPEPIEQNTEPTTPELVAMKAKAARDRQPSPSVSQKRRRETVTPRSNAQPRKRARADRSIVAADEQPTGNGLEAPGADESPKSPTNAQNVAGLGSAGEGEDQDELALPGEEPLPTSELNRAAKAQLVAEANAKNIDSDLPSQPLPQTDVQQTETAPNPIPNQASESPIEAPAAEQAGAVSPSNVESQVAGSAADEIIPSGGLQLTEENLANQQAAHGVKLSRASDLRENDEDLSSYAQYLQKLVAGHIAGKTAQNQTEEGRNATEVDTDVQPTRELSPALGAQVPPKSAEDRQMKTGGQNAQVSAANDEFDALLESDLPGGDQAFASQVAIDFDPFNSQDHALNTGFVPVDDAVRNWVQPATNNEPQDASGQQGFDEEMTDNVEIDLTLAEPEGGFTFSSQEDAQPDGLPSQHQWEPTQPPALDQTHVNGGLNGTLNAPELSEDEVMEGAPAKSATPRAHAALDTQDIYAAGAQQPDFSFPLPPDSDAGEDESELPADPTRKPTSAQQPTTSSRKRSASATPRKVIPTSTRQEPETPETESVESFIARLTATGHAPDTIRNAIYRTSAQLQAAEVVARYEKLGVPVPDLPEVWSAEDDAQVGTTDAKVFKALCEKKGWEEYDLRLKFLQEWRA
nr:MYB transcription factor 14 [Cladosporium cladosporioides]